MKRLRWALVFAVPAALLALVTLSSCQRSLSAKPFVKNGQDGIIGGKLVSADDPIQKVIVRILMLNSSGKYSACTGTIVSNEFILTAAHCFQQKSSGRAEPERIFLGDGIEASAQGVFLHPSYDDTKRFDQNDVALLKFLSANVTATAQLPMDDETPVAGSGYFVAGYGRTEVDTPVINAKLYKLESSVMIPDLTDSEMVVFSSETSGTCFGDSGGPFYSTQDGTIKVHSILSRSTPDSKDCLGSDIQTRIEPSLGWINQVFAGQISPRVPQRRNE